MRRWLWWILGLTAFFVMFYSCALPGDLPVGVDTEGDLPGTYSVNGIDPAGTEYSGTVVITAVDGDDTRVMVEWIITGTIQQGEGRRIGDELTVTWETVAAGADPTTGSADYRIEADGRLVGTRTIDGVDGVATEEIFPQP